MAAVDAVIEPLERQTQQDTLPDTADATTVEGVWTDFDPQIANRWLYSLDGTGAQTLRDGISKTPNWALGDSTIKAQYLKIGQLVRVKIIFTHGTQALYAGNSSALVGGFPQPVGEFGETSIVLPFAPPSQGHAAYAFGLSALTQTTIDGSGILTRGAFFSKGEGITFGSDISAAGGFTGRVTYNGRLAIGVDYGSTSWESNVPIYYSGAPGFSYAQPGELFVLFLKYTSAS